MSRLRWANLILGLLAVLAPAAHVLEMPNKLALDATLWLTVQTHLYRGWGPLWGAPVELAALATSLFVAAVSRKNSETRPLALVAAAAYGGMIAVFFAFNWPVNASVNRWTPATLPANWPRYRLVWETGHALAAVLALIALAALLWAFLTDFAAQRAN